MLLKLRYLFVIFSQLLYLLKDLSKWIGFFRFLFVFSWLDRKAFRDPHWIDVLGYLVLVGILINWQIDYHVIWSVHALWNRLLDGFAMVSATSQGVNLSARVLGEKLQLLVIYVVHSGTGAGVSLSLADAIWAGRVAVAFAIFALVVASAGSSKECVSTWSLVTWGRQWRVVIVGALRSQLVVLRGCILIKLIFLWNLLLSEVSLLVLLELLNLVDLSSHIWNCLLICWFNRVKLCNNIRDLRSQGLWWLISLQLSISRCLILDVLEALYDLCKLMTYLSYLRGNLVFLREWVWICSLGAIRLLWGVAWTREIYWWVSFVLLHCLELL